MAEAPRRPLAETAPSARRSGASAARERPYLLVVEGTAARTLELPSTGAVVIGREEEVELCLSDPAVSRRHACISVVEGEATIVDLDSQNGTRVNGDRIADRRPLLSGDIVQLGEATLVYHPGRLSAAATAVLDLTHFHARAHEELERSLLHDDALSLIAVSLGDGRSPRGAVDAAVAATLRPIDRLAWIGDGEILVLLPDVGRDEAPVACDRLIEALGQVAPKASGGWASLPDDGCDVHALEESARAAARSASPTGQAAAAETVRRLALAGTEVIVADAVMLRVYDLLARLGASPLPVLVCGETGTGKELAAAALHQASPRRDGPFVVVNCAALAEGLVESELFGHERGAFTGAATARAGLFEAAEGGTIFLDEVGELPPVVQAKLLRILEDRVVTRVGATRGREIDVRVVAATNRDLRAECAAGQFRQDLYFRLGGATVWLPPLRDRPRELPLLARALLARACRDCAREPVTLDDTAVRRLSEHGWPGNVRELRNLMGLVAATVIGPAVTDSDVAPLLSPTREPIRIETAPSSPGSAAVEFRPISEELRQLERTRMQEALEAAGGNRTHAAELIRMPLRTFMGKLKQYGLG